MSKEKIMSPRDAEGRRFRRGEPVNPVNNVDFAYVMGMAGQSITLRHERAVRRVERARQADHNPRERGLNRPVSAQDRFLATQPVEVLRDAAMERSRSSIAGHYLASAQELFNLVEIEPVAALEETLQPSQAPILPE